MSKTQNSEVRFLDACQKGELQTILELAESKAVDPSTVVEKRRDHEVWFGDYYYLANGWTPLHYAAA